jgi:hypothetical protein
LKRIPVVYLGWRNPMNSNGYVSALGIIEKY